MKTIFIVAAFLLTAPGALAQKIEFARLSHDFGEIARREGDVSYRFAFTNTGAEPLVVTRTAVSCSCVRVIAPKETIAPGVTGFLEVVYRAGKQFPGEFYKVVDVYTNSEVRRVSLVIKGVATDD